jgi:hypothetical protein
MNSCAEWYQILNPLEPPPNKSRKVKERKGRAGSLKIVQSRREKVETSGKQKYCSNAGL